MVIVDRLLRALATRWRFAVTPWSVLRILLVTALSLALASWLLPARPGDLSLDPYNREFHSAKSRNVSLPIGDTRGFAPVHRRGTFEVAWVGGSETLRVARGDRRFIPELVGDRVGRVDGRRIWTDVYFLNAIRMADELAALEAALASKPDLVVVSLNPLWVLNDLGVQQWSYLDGVLARHATWPPSHWPVAASLASPGDVGWTVLSAASRPIRDRYEWGVDLAARTGGWTFLTSVPDRHPQARTGLGTLAGVRPVDFFLHHSPAVHLPPGADLTRIRASVLEREAASASTFNAHVLRQMLSAARRAGVVAYFYMPPINQDAYADPQVAGWLTTVSRRLAEATRGQTTDRVVLDPAGLQRRLPAMRFADLVHIFRPGPEVNVLAQDLCTLLTRQGHRTECERR